jgi:hypothetical protein
MVKKKGPKTQRGQIIKEWGGDGRKTQRTLILEELGLKKRKKK